MMIRANNELCNDCMVFQPRNVGLMTVRHLHLIHTQDARERQITSQMSEIFL